FLEIGSSPSPSLCEAVRPRRTAMHAPNYLPSASPRPVLRRKHPRIHFPALFESAAGSFHIPQTYARTDLFPPQDLQSIVQPVFAIPVFYSLCILSSLFYLPSLLFLSRYRRHDRRSILDPTIRLAGLPPVPLSVVSDRRFVPRGYLESSLPD